MIGIFSFETDTKRTGDYMVKMHFCNWKIMSANMATLPIAFINLFQTDITNPSDISCYPFSHSTSEMCIAGIQLAVADCADSMNARNQAAYTSVLATSLLPYLTFLQQL